MTALYNNGGFTLIELLVVVLIIGILASVALSQYQKSVEKSRAVQAITLARALHDAQEAYYLENGQYVYSKTQLPVDITCPTDYTCIVNSQTIKIQHKDYDWYISYSHNYRSDAAAYAKGKFYCWDNRAKTVCSKLGKRWYGVDTNKYLLN
ncbi:MAG: type II secretion system protein [Elusimicrobiaceae bacterium]|nr:type II secretion system protein [Elusimicrobiaceae bacterium]